MSRINVPPALVREAAEALALTSEIITRLSQAINPEDLTNLRGLYDGLGTVRHHVANILNGSTLTHRLPPELLTKIVNLSADPDSDKYAERITALSHVCQYWRSVILSDPRLWSTIHMKPGNPLFISECLARSQKAPLTILAEFVDPYNHPRCRYFDSATTTIEDANRPEVCIRHRAVLSLNQLLPHCSRILHLNIVLHSSDHYWDDHEDYPMLLLHKFFSESLPSLQRLDLRASYVGYTVPALSLFTEHFPCLKELKYLGMFGGPMVMAKDLMSCEIGSWPSAAGPATIDEPDLRVLLDNNRTLESLTVYKCDFLSDGVDGLAVIPMENLRCLNADCLISDTLRTVLDSIHAPQFKDLDTVRVSFRSLDMIVRATDGSGRVFQYSRTSIDDSHYHPLQSLGARITTLRLRIREIFRDPDIVIILSGFLGTLDTVQVLESDGMVADGLQAILSQPGMLPGLKIVRVAIDGAYCENALRFLASFSRSRMEEGNPLAAIELCTGEGGRGLDQGFRAEWERRFSEEGIPDFLVG